MANTALYSDFSLDFTIHPIKKDLVLRKDADAVIASIRNLLLTNHFEVPFRPELGCNIRKMLFENISLFTANDISRFIEETISNFEPRARIASLVVTPNYDDNGYSVSLQCFIGTASSPLDVNFLLERVR